MVRADSLRTGLGGHHVVTLVAARVDSLPPFEQMGPVPDVIERARSGDRSAFADLYDTHVDAVYRYILYRVREPGDAEDRTRSVSPKMDRPRTSTQSVVRKSMRSVARSST